MQCLASQERHCIPRWYSPMGFPELQVIFRKRATNSRLFCGKCPMKIRHPMYLCHPVIAFAMQGIASRAMQGMSCKDHHKRQHSRCKDCTRILAETNDMPPLSASLQDLCKNPLMIRPTHTHKYKHKHERTNVYMYRNPRPCHCVLQCVAVCCSVWQCVAMCCSVLQCVAVCCNVLQCVAVCCRVLQCVAVCCSVFQCVAV